jgi:glycosyltransferase involved in cell wall biosynthesis
MGYTKPSDIIGHGTDFEKFFPLDKHVCRKELGVPEDAFIVFNGNRNQPRKRIDLTLKAFIKFAKDKYDTRIWLNMGSKDLGWEIIPLFKRIARDEGFDEVADWFETLAKAERSHANRYQKALDAYKADNN